jgi:hypothetical protein
LKFGIFISIDEFQQSKGILLELDEGDRSNVN